MKYFLAVILSFALVTASLMINCQQEPPTPVAPTSPDQTLLENLLEADA